MSQNVRFLRWCTNPRFCIVGRSPVHVNHDPSAIAEALRHPDLGLMACRYVTIIHE